jgi:hypothetical protein
MLGFLPAREPATERTPCASAFGVFSWTIGFKGIVYLLPLNRSGVSGIRGAQPRATRCNPENDMSGNDRIHALA